MPCRSASRRRSRMLQVWGLFVSIKVSINGDAGRAIIRVPLVTCAADSARHLRVNRLRRIVAVQQAINLTLGDDRSHADLHDAETTLANEVKDLRASDAEDVGAFVHAVTLPLQRVPH